MTRDPGGFRALLRVLLRIGAVAVGVFAGTAAVHFLGWWAVPVFVVPGVLGLWWMEAHR